MEDQVLSREQMQELIDLGIDTSKASMHWYYQTFYDNHFRPFWSLQINRTGNLIIPNEEIIPTFTLEDILKLIPDDIEVSDVVYSMILTKHGIFYKSGDGKYLKGFSKEFILGNAFEMLKWCKQNKYI